MKKLMKSILCVLLLCACAPNVDEPPIQNDVPSTVEYQPLQVEYEQYRNQNFQPMGRVAETTDYIFYIKDDRDVYRFNKQTAQTELIHDASVYGKVLSIYSYKDTVLLSTYNYTTGQTADEKMDVDGKELTPIINNGLNNIVIQDKYIYVDVNRVLYKYDLEASEFVDTTPIIRLDYLAISNKYIYTTSTYDTTFVINTMNLETKEEGQIISDKFRYAGIIKPVQDKIYLDAGSNERGSELLVIDEKTNEITVLDKVLYLSDFIVIDNYLYEVEKFIKWENTEDGTEEFRFESDIYRLDLTTLQKEQIADNLPVDGQFLQYGGGYLWLGDYNDFIMLTLDGKLVNVDL